MQLQMGPSDTHSYLQLVVCVWHGWVEGALWQWSHRGQTRVTFNLSIACSDSVTFVAKCISARHLVMHHELVCMCVILYVTLFYACVQTGHGFMLWLTHLLSSAKASTVLTLAGSRSQPLRTLCAPFCGTFLSLSVSHSCSVAGDDSIE